MGKYNIAIIGPKEIVLGFKAIGVKTVFSSTWEETLQHLESLKSNASEKYAIIFILEEHAKHIPREDYKELTADPLPAIIALPGAEGSTGFGVQRLGQIVEKAIGSNILKE